MDLGVDLQHCWLQLGPSTPPQHSLEPAGAAAGWLVPSPGATIPHLSVSSAPQPPPARPARSHLSAELRGAAGDPRASSCRDFTASPYPGLAVGHELRGGGICPLGHSWDSPCSDLVPRVPKGSPGPQSLPGDTGTSAPCWRHPGASCLAPGARHPPHLSVFGRKLGLKSPTGKKQDREKNKKIKNQEKSREINNVPSQTRGRGNYRRYQPPPLRAGAASPGVGGGAARD